MCAACDRGKPTHCRQSFGGMAQRYQAGGQPAYAFANAGVFSERVVVGENQAVVIDPRVPLSSACLIGCAVVTGAGAVLNRANVQPGESVAVIGAGGIGQSVIQAARLSNASRVVVIDANPAKEAAARQFGATDFIDASVVTDTVSAARDLGFPNGFDYTFECVGHPALIRNAIDMLDWGGTCVMLGVPKPGTEVSYVVQSMYQDKSIYGCRYGSTRPHHDIPLIVQLYLDGKFLLDEMVSQQYAPDDVQVALDDLEAGKLNRGVLAFV
jgi:S-(hydroxymethyl)glutathione dehydrogenase/alcohol dehydrogenase